MEFIKAFGAYVAFDHMSRSNNYHEMADRLRGHIRRWEDTLERLENAKNRTLANLSQNSDRLKKAYDFQARLTSAASQSWLERQRVMAVNHHDEARRAEASAKVQDHQSKVASVNGRITKLTTWISEGEIRLRSIRDKISATEEKISDARRKL